jgi:hypothetical protein
MSASKLINEFIEKFPTGEPFTTPELLKFGSRSNVDKVLSRLVETKKIARIARGIFVKQEIVPYVVGSVLPEPSKIAASVARISGEIVTIHGAEAARQLQLTTQVPTKTIFLTTGATRHIKVGKTEICLKHVAPRKIANSNTVEGLVISALWYLGKQQVNGKVISKIKSRLTDEQFQNVQASVGLMPGWMVDVFYRYKKEHINAR